MSSSFFAHPNNDQPANMKFDTILSLRLKNLGFCDCPQVMDRVQQFCCALGQTDPERVFSSAVDMLTKATLMFALIEEDSYRKLSFAELQLLARHDFGAGHTILSWVVSNFHALTALNPCESSRGLSRHDILLARNLFRGLDYAHRCFELIAPDPTATALHDNDILLYVWSCGNSLDADVRRGLLQLAAVLQG